MRAILLTPILAVAIIAIASTAAVTPAGAAKSRHVHRRSPTPQIIQNRSVYVPVPSSAPTPQNFTLPPAGGPSVYQPISPSGTPDLRQRF